MRPHPLLLALLTACGAPDDPRPGTPGGDPGADPAPHDVDPGPAGAPLIAAHRPDDAAPLSRWAEHLPDDDDVLPLDPGDTAYMGAPPLCRILQPRPGAVFPRGTAIHFEADVVDPDGDLSSVIWWSDRWGAMVTGLRFDFILPPGEHLVTVEGEDHEGNRCVEDVDLTVL